MSSEILTTIAAQQSADLQRVAAKLGSDVIPYLKRIESGIEDILKPYYDMSITQARQAKIIAAIDELTNAELSEYLKDFNKSVSAIGVSSVASGVNALEAAIIADVKINTPKKSEIDAAVISTPIQQGDKSWTTYKGIQSAFKDQYKTEVNSAMLASMQGAQNGKEVADAAYTQLHYTGRKASKSVLDRARRSANSLSATASNHAANVARVKFGEANKRLIKGYRSISVIDSVTSKQCRSLDQTVMSADDPRFSIWAPPSHRGCRRTLTYEVDDRYKLDDESSKRASSFRVDGLQDPKPISSKQTYYEAMSKLKAADQDEILGPTLGRAFRKGLDDGTLTPESFAKMTVDSLFQPLTIQQMEQRSNRLGEILRAQNKKG